MDTKLLYIFTRTPLHVGAGSSVGAIDQPVQRERHTGFPIIPASSLKGSFADHWNAELIEEISETDQKTKRVRVTKDKVTDAAWLFGSDNDKDSFAGALLFSEARLLAFPIRSAKGSYAWITCPLMLQRAARDGVFTKSVATTINALGESADGEAIYGGSKIDLGGKVVLEEYCFTQSKRNSAPEKLPDGLAAALADLVAGDALFSSITERLVILSNGMMSHFVNTTCEIAQHVRISDETGTAEKGGLFNQENVPSDTLFYSVLNTTDGRGKQFKGKKPEEAAAAFKAKVDSVNVFQFGGDASTGLGFCTVTMGLTNPVK